MPDQTLNIGETIGRFPGVFIAVCIALFLFGVAFNYATTQMHKNGASEGYTWLLVVIGTATVLIFALPFIGLSNVLALFLLFAAAGLPMVAGDIHRYVKAKRAFERRQQEENN